VVYEYVNQLVARGHEVAVVHPRHLSRFPPPPVASFYQGLRRAMGKVRNLVFTPGVDWQPLDKRVRMLYVSEPVAGNVPDGDAVFATAWQTAEYVAGYPLSKGEKFYLVMDFAPFMGEQEQLEATWRQPFQKVTISNWLYEQVCRAEASSGRVVNIPLGISHKQFRLTTEIERRPEQAAMFVGYSTYKAPHDGISALKIAKQRHPEMSVVLFGQGNDGPENTSSWASYRGNIPHESLVGIYNSSSIFVYSSLAEGFALPPSEARSAAAQFLQRRALSGLLHDHVFPALIRKDWGEVDAVSSVLRDHFQLGSYALAVKALGRMNRYLPPVRGLMKSWDRRIKSRETKAVENVRHARPSYSQLLEV
jgi:glycosyltransferase involved in cell wall biosynthesis